MSDPKIDRRNARADRTRAALLTACRMLMAGGDFRPSMAAIVKRACVSNRSGFQHYTTIENLHAAALKDPVVGRAILLAVTAGHTGCLDWPAAHQDAVVHAIVFGRAPMDGEMARAA